VNERQRYREVLAINRAIASAEEYEDVLRLVVERTAAFTGATACMLLLSQEDGMARVVRSVGLDPARTARLAVPLSERIDAELCSLLGFQARDGFVGVPVIGREGVMGILAVYRQATQCLNGGGDDELISAFADQAAIALDNAERVRRLREAREREASRQRTLLLASVTEALNRGVDLRQVVDVAIRRGVQVLGREDGSVYLLEPDGRHMRGFSEVWEKGRTGAVISLDDSPNAKRALETLQPHFFTLEECSDVEMGWMRRIGIRARLIVPLQLEEGCVGFLFINYEREEDRPSQDEVEFATAIAAQCALAIGRARAYEAERSARHEAEATAQLQEQVMAVVGHDLRTPLSAITMATTLMFKRGELSPPQAMTLGRISSSAARMASIIGDLLDFSRARSGLGIAIQKGRVDLGAVCRRVIAEFEEDVEPSRRIALVTEGDLEVEADGSRVAQVLSNLVGNALQHGGGMQVEVRAAGRDGDVIISVHNDGPAIPPALLPHIFKPFRRGENSSKQGGRNGSIGLGLFIVSEIVKAHGGKVEARSEEGSGTTFTVSLPRGGLASR
jgi:signal transduction histidine kinase